MKTILENNDLLVAWLKMPSACRTYLLEQKAQALHVNFDTIDGYHFANDVNCYLRALVDSDVITKPEGTLIYNLVIGVDEK